MNIIQLLTLTIVLVACQAPDSSDESSQNELTDLIRINQVGYYPEAIKVFAVADIDATAFRVLDAEGSEVFSGELTGPQTWEASGESVRTGNFTSLNTPGNYLIILDGYTSYPFEISEDLYAAPLDAAVKSYYFQRASMAITPEFGGDYAREAGHPDDACIYHPSSGKTGTMPSPGGWYDAGDYGKYIVNAALSVGQMLNLLEIQPVVLGERLNIPESGNGVDDLADELRYELDWMLTMQDDDGGVFHKMTGLGFSGMIMPADYDLDRYVIGKGTAASLSFAAVMAQASRVYAGIDPGFSQKALEAARGAYYWALNHRDVAFRNPEDISTGEYGDNRFDDDFYWAQTELSLADTERVYAYEPQPVFHEITNSWRNFVRNVGFNSTLIHNAEADIRQDYLGLADSILQVTNAHPYKIGLSHYEWGSSSDVLNQAVILCMAHAITDDQKYLNGAVMITDYIFGKNATGYSFLTGFGTKQVMNIHHRPSEADGIEAPVPGFISGGPNIDQQDRQYVTYTYDLPAKSFEDVVESYASNEVCLNWNAPAVFVLGYLEKEMK